jgi:hypothetical protein
MQVLAEEVRQLALRVSQDMQMLIDHPLSLSTVAQQSIDVICHHLKENNIPILTPV